jgi:hypothetical protein
MNVCRVSKLSRISRFTWCVLGRNAPRRKRRREVSSIEYGVSNKSRVERAACGMSVVSKVDLPVTENSMREWEFACAAQV